MNARTLKQGERKIGSQLAVYLMLLGVKPPHLYGLGVEDVIALATT